MEYARAGHGISEDSKWFQVKAGSERKIKEDGPVPRLKSARPRGRLISGRSGRTCEYLLVFTSPRTFKDCPEVPTGDPRVSPAGCRLAIHDVLLSKAILWCTRGNDELSFVNNNRRKIFCR